MNTGDVIIANVIAIGGDNIHSFMFPVNEKSTKPIIVEERLRLNGTYKIEITRDATNFYIAKVISSVKK